MQVTYHIYSESYYTQLTKSYKPISKYSYTEINFNSKNKQGHLCLKKSTSPRK